MAKGFLFPFLGRGRDISLAMPLAQHELIFWLTASRSHLFLGYHILHRTSSAPFLLYIDAPHLQHYDKHPQCYSAILLCYPSIALLKLGAVFKHSHLAPLLQQVGHFCSTRSNFPVPSSSMPASFPGFHPLSPLTHPRHSLFSFAHPLPLGHTTALTLFCKFHTFVKASSTITINSHAQGRPGSK
jgi:hypothetical protein